MDFDRDDVGTLHRLVSYYNVRGERSILRVYNSNLSSLVLRDSQIIECEHLPRPFRSSFYFS